MQAWLREGGGGRGEMEGSVRGELEGGKATGAEARGTYQAYFV